MYRYEAAAVQKVEALKIHFENCFWVYHQFIFYRPKFCNQILSARPYNYIAHISVSVLILCEDLFVRRRWSWKVIRILSPFRVSLQCRTCSLYVEYSTYPLWYPVCYSVCYLVSHLVSYLVFYTVVCWNTEIGIWVKIMNI